MLVFVGQIRPYKNVVALVRHFAEVGRPEDQLLVAGNPHQAELARDIEKEAAGHSNVHLRLGQIAGSEMDRLLRCADAVVLPYESILNSGTALLALSFARPVVVPAVGSLTELARDVGTDWVRTYSGEFDSEVLRRALTDTLPSGEPDLSAFDWDPIAQSTMAAYRSGMRSTWSARVPRAIRRDLRRRRFADCDSELVPGASADGQVAG
jgi:glycosyltransferase involved in cell wall biosynthesis